MAGTTVVSKVTGDVCVPAPKTAKQSFDMCSSRYKNTGTTQKSQVATVSLESEWKNHLTTVLGWSSKAAGYYQHYLAPSTLSLYNRYINLFEEYCRKHIRKFPPSENEQSAIVAEFLCVRAEMSEHPESMLTSILAALNQLFQTSDMKPLPTWVFNLKHALVKVHST